MYVCRFDIRKKSWLHSIAGFSFALACLPASVHARQSKWLGWSLIDQARSSDNKTYIRTAVCQQSHEKCNIVLFAIFFKTMIQSRTGWCVCVNFWRNPKYFVSYI